MRFASTKVPENWLAQPGAAGKGINKAEVAYFFVGAPSTGTLIVWDRTALSYSAKGYIQTELDGQESAGALVWPDVEIAIGSGDTGVS